jgi:hypothetical protein
MRVKIHPATTSRRRMHRRNELVDPVQSVEARAASQEMFFDPRLHGVAQGIVLQDIIRDVIHRVSG